jgi:hypothetical protein
MKTTDLFTINRAPKKLNETIEKLFGRKINLEAFDLPQLEDARNKLRTQVHQVRNSSGFNENLENDAFLEAQWMLDAINAEIAQRESIVEFGEPMPQEQEPEDQNDPHGDPDPSEYDREGGMAKGQLSTAEEAAEELRSILDSAEDMPEWVQAKITMAVDYLDTARDYMKGKHADGVQPHDADMGESAPEGWEGTVKAMKKHKEIDNPYALAWSMKNKGYKSHKKESIGEGMANLREGEIQQASAIVTAKTMVDRVSRWIEELSGMENDTLLQLGDSIRDEMGADQAKRFISACAPAIQAALQNLKDTRETLSSGVRALTGEEQPSQMLGGAPEAADEFGGPAEPDSMNMGGEDEIPTDDFAASEPGVGGMETAGREQRESIQRSSQLLKILAG